jgi:hypothetical protein
VADTNDPYVIEMRADSKRNPFPGKYTPDMVTLMIPQQDPRFEPGGDKPVCVTINGKNLLIPRGEWVDVPYAYAAALANAKTTLYASDDRRGLTWAGEGYQYPYHTRA